jgi:hypothetical protein
MALVALGRRAPVTAPPVPSQSRPPPSAPPLLRPPPAPRRHNYLPLPLQELVRRVRRADPHTGRRLPPGPRELALLTSHIMGVATERQQLGAAAAAAVAASSHAPATSSSSWRAAYSLFAEFSDVLNAVHVSALLTALPRLGLPQTHDDGNSQNREERDDFEAFAAELVELACQLLPGGAGVVGGVGSSSAGGGSREMVACIVGCARLWGASARGGGARVSHDDDDAFSEQEEEEQEHDDNNDDDRRTARRRQRLRSPAARGTHHHHHPPAAGAVRRLSQLVTARIRPLFLSDAELAALGWAIAELGHAPPPAFVRAYASAARRRLLPAPPGGGGDNSTSMRAGELAQVGRALALLSARAAAAAPSASPPLVPVGWVEDYARACARAALGMSARDVAGAAWAAAALARRAVGEEASSPPVLPALLDALLRRSAEVAGDLEDRHVATLLWACGAFAPAAATACPPRSRSSSCSPFPLFDATALRSWPLFSRRVLDEAWPALLRTSSTPARALRHSAVAMVAAARLDATALLLPGSPFAAATLAAAQAGLVAAAAYLAPPLELRERDEAEAEEEHEEEEEDRGGRHRAPPNPRWARPSASLLRDASSVLWALERAAAAQQKTDDASSSLGVARAAAAAMAEALALRRRWRARALLAGRRRRYGPDGLPFRPPLAMRPADLSVSLWSLARLGDQTLLLPRRLLRDAAAEASALLPNFGARETAGLLLGLAKARHADAALGERALVHFASMLPPPDSDYDDSDSLQSPRDLAAALYGGGFCLRRRGAAAAGPPLLPPPDWALRRLARASMRALPNCGPAELVMLLRGFSAMRWHPGKAWAGAHVQRCIELSAAAAAGGGKGARGFTVRETAALRRAARRLHALRPDGLE